MWVNVMYGLTRDDVKQVLGYIIGFVASYAIFMSSNHLTGYLNWGAFATGFVGMSSYHIGSNMSWNNSVGGVAQAAAVTEQKAKLEEVKKDA